MGRQPKRGGRQKFSAGDDEDSSEVSYGCTLTSTNARVLGAAARARPGLGLAHAAHEGPLAPTHPATHRRRALAPEGALVLLDKKGAASWITCSDCSM